MFPTGKNVGGKSILLLQSHRPEQNIQQHLTPQSLYIYSSFYTSAKQK